MSCTPVPKPVSIYEKMRNQILTLTPGEAGIAPTPETSNVWGGLMETGYPRAVATLVALADGTTSLYFGSGGGMIGGGNLAPVAQASRTLAARAEKYFQAMSPAASFPPPCVGRVRFYVLTFSGAFTADADKDELGRGKHALSFLFYSAQEVLTQLRLNSQQQK